MDLTHDETTPAVDAGGSAADGRYERCDQCGVPLDEQQRYCVNCGARRRAADDPVAAYLSGATRAKRRRPPARSSGVLSGRAPVIFLALLPVAVGIGVLVGRLGGHNEDKLLAALRNQKPQVVNLGAAAQGTNVATASGGLASDFSLKKGFTVQLSTLPAAGTDQAAVTKAEHAARTKGAAKVGLINPKDFKITPSAGNNYIIYSGEFKKKGDAEKALSRLKRKFPSARVIAVQSANDGGTGTPVVAHTAYGDVHRITGYRPSAAKIRSDTNLARQIARQKGQTYVQTQRGLPDVISVGGSGGGSTPSGPQP